jgi:Spermine/spermidine synthase domain
VSGDGFLGRSRPGLAAAGLSAFIFLLEVLLTRIFSVTLFHHFAFAAISLGMLGLAVAGVRVALAPDRFTPERADDDVTRAAGLATWTGVATTLVIVQMGVFPVFSWSAVFRLVFIYCLCSVPFYFAGLALALVFTHGRKRFSVLYASDLVAAGVAGLAVFPLLRWLGGPGAMVAATTLAAAGALAAFPAARAAARRAAWGAMAVALGVVLADGQWGLLRLRRPKGAESARVLYEAWNALSRVAVYDAPLWPWSLSPTYRGPVAPALRLDIDAAAATPIVPAAAPQAQNEYLEHELTSAAEIVAPHGRALVIGSGGGRDVLAALLSGVQRVDAVEINPIIVNDVMRGRFRKASGGLYDDPRVHVRVADGRSFVRGSPDSYDLIQLSLVDTWAATAAGAFALSENTLYTREAVREYIEHLSPDGVLTLTRWAGGETFRMVVLVSAVAHSMGVADVGRHLAIVSFPDDTASRNVPVVLLYRRSPFDGESDGRLSAFIAGNGFRWLHDPMRVVAGRVSAMARADDALAEARKTEAYDLSPPTDDRPFFFYRPGPFLAGLRQEPTRIFTEGRYLVATVLALAALMGGLGILLPLWRRGSAELRANAGVALGVAPYYVGIGLGFMLVEVSLMQRFVLYLGHPTPALTAVVAGILAGAGVGSALTGAWVARGREPWPVWTAVVAATTLVVLDVVGRRLLLATQALPLPQKVLMTELLVVPMGMALGTVMPAGMRELSQQARGLVPWAWGINGFASVVGACLGALVSMAHGFSRTYQLGVACYVVASLAALAVTLRRRSSEALDAPEAVS